MDGMTATDLNHAEAAELLHSYHGYWFALNAKDFDVAEAHKTRLLEAGLTEPTFDVWDPESEYPAHRERRLKARTK